MNTKKQKQKKKNVAYRVKIFLVTHISGKKSFFFLAQSTKSSPKLYLRRKGNNKQ